MNARQTEKSIRPRELHRRLAAGETGLLPDVRTPGEHAAAHVPGMKLIPLDELDTAAFNRKRGSDGPPVYVFCQSGIRARRAIEKIGRAGGRDCVLVEGGIQAWMDAGLPVNRGESRVRPIRQQVQITVGLLSAIGALLALTVNSCFALIPLVIGSGLLFAGLTGFCGLALR
jgi:rhodanese-related sulfurtransferase